LSSVVTDGTDGNGLQLEKIWLKFSKIFKLVDIKFASRRKLLNIVAFGMASKFLTRQKTGLFINKLCAVNQSESWKFNDRD